MVTACDLSLRTNEYLRYRALAIAREARQDKRDEGLSEVEMRLRTTPRYLQRFRIRLNVGSDQWADEDSGERAMEERMAREAELLWTFRMRE